jgi:hypothetical protein
LNRKESESCDSSQSTDNTITAFPAAEQIPEGQEHFAAEKELAKAAAEWPIERLVQIWNSFAGVAGPFSDLKPVKKFTDRRTAVARIWKAIQKLDGPAESETTATASQAATSAPKAAKGGPKKAKAAKVARHTKGASTAREGSKKAKVLDMMRRKDGATLKEIMAAAAWQAHSVRGFISIAGKKLGLKIESTKRKDGERGYQIV